jgi:hypothetical protein
MTKIITVVIIDNNGKVMVEKESKTFPISTSSEKQGTRYDLGLYEVQGELNVPRQYVKKIQHGLNPFLFI